VVDEVVSLFGEFEDTPPETGHAPEPTQLVSCVASAIVTPVIPTALTAVHALPEPTSWNTLNVCGTPAL